MKTLLILLLLSVPACENGGAPTEPIMEKAPPPAATAPAPLPMTDVAAPKPGEPPERPTPTLQALEDAGASTGKGLQPNGCLAGYTDLGACCVPPRDPGDCDCRKGALCARNCTYDSNHVANVAVFCTDGGV